MGDGLVLPLCVILPFVAAAFVGPLHRAFGRRLGVALAAVPLGILLLLVPGAVRGDTDRWSRPWAPELGLSFAFRIDPLSASFALLVAFVGVAVFPYARGYLGDKPESPRLFALLLAFTGSMLGLLLADDLILLFVFWELTSITSFGLIGFDSSRPAARRAAQQAFLVTFGGGLCLLAGAILIGSAAGTTRLSDIPGTLQFAPEYKAILVLVVIAAATKSAQVPFHFWLPNAMEAPTPVSAFLHSATMVQGGIYLLARLSPILGETTLWSNGLTVLGCTTVLVGTLALRQRDVKAVLACSTIGALGLLVTAIGQGFVAAALPFLIAHGLYKSGLFFVAGNLTHASGSRDIRAMHGLGSRMPLTRVGALLAAASMAALPLTLGFVGKDVFLHEGSLVFLSTTMLFGATSVAVALLVGVGPFVGKPSHPDAHESPGWMTGALLLPAASGIAIGILTPIFGFLFAGRRTAVLPALGPTWGLSAIIWVAGFVLCLGIRNSHARERLPSLDAGYDSVRRLIVASSSRLSTWQLRGQLDAALRVTFAAFVVLIAMGILRMGTRIALVPGPPPTFYEAGLTAAILVAGGAVVLLRSRLAAVAALGIVGYGVAVLYVGFGAPDVAMTQIAVETLTLILFVFTFLRLPRHSLKSPNLHRLRDSIVAGCVATAMGGVTWIAASLPPDATVSRFYSDSALSQGHGRNVVSVILADFRGFDTLGEITVLVIAALGVYALLRVHRKGGASSAP